MAVQIKCGVQQGDLVLGRLREDVRPGSCGHICRAIALRQWQPARDALAGNSAGGWETGLCWGSCPFFLGTHECKDIIHTPLMLILCQYIANKVEIP